MESLLTQNGKFLEGCLQFRQQSDGHPQSALLFLCKISFSHQEIIQRNLKECCKFYGQFDWAGLFSIFNFCYVGSADIHLLCQLLLCEPTIFPQTPDS